MGIKLTLLIFFCALMIAIGILTRRRTHGVDEFVLGGRTVGPWLTAFAYGTSYFSAVVFVGYAGQFGWKYGIASTWIGIGNALIGSLLAWVVLGRRTRLMTKHLAASTMPDFFGKRFDSRNLKIISSIIIFVFMIPYTASVYTGLSRLFSMAFHIDYAYCMIAMAVLTAVYVILGGYVATAVNDFIQGIIMLLGIVAVIVSVLSGQGGFSAALQSLSEVTADGGGFTSCFGPAPLSLLGVVILTSLGTWGLPQMVHKFYSIQSEDAIRKGTVISTVFALIVAGGSYFLGGFGRLYADYEGVIVNGTVRYDNIIPTMLSGLPDIMIGIVVVLVLSASMSTLSGLVLTSSSSLTLDLISGTLVKHMTEQKKVRCIRLLIAVFVLISVLIALDPPTFIAQLMGISWGALAGSFLAPFLYGLFSKKVTRAGVWASFATGVGITTLAMVANFFDLTVSPVLKWVCNPINAGAIAMLVGLIVVPLVSMVSPKLPEETVNACFVAYQKPEKELDESAQCTRKERI